LLGGILRQARAAVAHAEVAQALAHALGELAAHCTIAGMRSGRLIIEVDSAPLLAELRGFRREEIRQAMNQRLSARQVGELVFRMGGPAA
jgi:hypothetical protein